MPDNLLIPSVDLRVGALEEYNRTQKQKALLHHKKPKPRPCVTISRQFGCLGYPVAERVCELLSQKSGEPWLLIDRAVLDEVAKRHNISKDILECLGEKNRLLDDLLATFSPRWTHSQDCFRLLCKHVVSLAEQGNVVIMELGGAIITRHFEHSKHFRIYGSMDFKVRAIAQRLQIEHEAAEKLVRNNRNNAIPLSVIFWIRMITTLSYTNCCLIMIVIRWEKLPPPSLIMLRMNFCEI